MFETIIRLNIFKWFIGPRKFSSYMGHFASKRMPKWLLNTVLRTYVSFYKIDMDQFVKKIGEFDSFNDFFTRKLKSGLRSFKGDLLSPAESVLSEYGKVKDDMVVEVKGMGCKLKEFLGKVMDVEFKSFAIFYLSPADYHRFHAPFDMQIEKIIYLPGDLYSVKPKSVAKNNTLFCENRKVIVYGNSEFGKFAMVLVGALVVGKIILNFGNHPDSEVFKEESVNISIVKGEEVGAFELGSTVILINESDVLDRLNVIKGEHVLVGQNLLN